MRIDYSQERSIAGTLLYAKQKKLLVPFKPPETGKISYIGGYIERQTPSVAVTFPYETITLAGFNPCTFGYLGQEADSTGIYLVAQHPEYQHWEAFFFFLDSQFSSVKLNALLQLVASE